MTSKKKPEQSGTSQYSDLPKSGLKPGDIIEPISTNEETPEKEEANAEAFNKMLKKYHKTSRDIRMSALIEEKKELEKMIKSPAKKYYEGSREDRLQALEEEKELMEKLGDISRNKN